MLKLLPHLTRHGKISPIHLDIDLSYSLKFSPTQKVNGCVRMGHLEVNESKTGHPKHVASRSNQLSYRLDYELSRIFSHEEQINKKY